MLPFRHAARRYARGVTGLPQPERPRLDLAGRALFGFVNVGPDRAAMSGSLNTGRATAPDRSRGPRALLSLLVSLPQPSLDDLGGLAVSERVLVGVDGVIHRR